MNNNTLWINVQKHIKDNEQTLKTVLREGQYETLVKISNGLIDSGMILADEVGLGKTFIALALMESIIDCGGTVGIVVPPGLMFQWKSEISKFRKLMKMEQSKINQRGVVELPKYFDIQNHPVFNIADKKSGPLVSHGKRPTLLISHNFSLPKFKEVNNPDWKKVSLPSLFFGLHPKFNSGVDFAKFAKERNQRMYNQAFFLANLPTLGFSKTEWDYIKNPNNRFLSELTFDKAPRILSDFKHDDDMKGILKKMAGHSIGKLDLIIIDEAHKSKAIKSEDTILGTLLGDILNPDKEKYQHLRVVGMSATPVELHPSQWELFLKRIGIESSIFDKKKEAINKFSDSLVAARKNPKNREHINSLIQRSGHFERTMKDVITRRRRFELKSFQELVEEIEKKGAHPNRKYENIVINFDDVEDEWRNTVLACEAISKAAKGMPDNRIIKLVDKRYASGLIGNEISENVKKSTAIPNEFEAAQEGRIEFWKSILKDIGEKEKGNDDHLNGHPRIQTAADHLEQCHEKVLVFGTFVRPLKALRNVVNYRYILRQVDKELPVRSPTKEHELKQIYEEYKRILIKGDKFRFHGTLAGEAKQFKDFCKILEDSRDYYEKIQISVNKFFKSYRLNNKKHEFYLVLDHADEIGKLGKDLNKFYDFLQHYVVSEITQNKEMLDQYEDEAKRKGERLTELAKEVWNHFVKGQTEVEEETDNENLNDSTSVNTSVFTVAQIKELVTGDEIVNNPVRSNFCRFMSGETPMKTRRTLQLQFNNLDGMPKVLIAQSQVGREGLNLHEACKRVMIFNPEWNPAVVEQQIGRVDRIGSYWEKLAQKHKKEGGEFPFIQIDFLVFKGTYDQFQFDRMKTRRAILDAQLFGALLPEEKAILVPDDLKKPLAEAAPDFSPLKLNL